MSAGRFYRPKPAADAISAWDLAYTSVPTVFNNARELGRAKAHQSLTMTEKGRANVQASNARLDAHIRPVRAARK